ncbi:peptidyl-prolyl cis-trans isomerase FKBP53-like isoform X1 [Quercus lobata]|uniref:peptidylprolyl isomerase n=1 Tax=Quercus lobata TaxID=97700 RepID=A0A7N2N4U0_QUELO|nr:peptidyl-prolyl cis-trans isomerase FKBP53-like isoform X1 [Quercus lobata]
MGFWGIEVKPGKTYPYHSDNVEGKLHVTQATLGLGSSSAERCILQCHVGHKSPIFLCSLLPDKNETCPLSLEFQSDDLVAFSVIGPRSIHLSGYFVANEGDGVLDDYDSDSFGEDIADTNSDESSEFDSEDGYEDEDDFIDDSDLDMYNPSHVPNSGVVIEEIVDDEKATNGNGQQKRKKKNRSSDSEDHRESQQQIVVKSHSSPVLESEDEDGFPVSTEHKSNLNIQKPEAEAEQKEKKASEKTKKKKKKIKDGDQATGLKRKVESVDQDDHPERQKKKNKKKRKEQAKEGEALESGNNTEINVPIEDEKQPELKRSSNLNQASPVENDHDHKLSNKKDLDVDMDNVTGKNSSEEKKKKKKKKKSTTQEGEGKATVDHTVSAVGNKEVEEKQSEVKSSQVRTFANGLVIEELQMGKPDGKRASPGKQVSVHYIGKLKSNGKIFDSNVGRAPFKFRLGIGHVIKGWDVGVNGMRIGDKRRLTIPPSMGYGAKTAGKIPPNSWLMFDVELVDVR